MRAGDDDIFDVGQPEIRIHDVIPLQVRKDLHVYRKYGHDEKLRSVRTLIYSERVIDIKVLTDLDGVLVH